MELSIDYACPECYRLQAVDLMEITPGKILYCKDCEIPLVLTEETLKNFSAELYKTPLG